MKHRLFLFFMIASLCVSTMTGCGNGLVEGMPVDLPAAPGPPDDMNGPMMQHRKDMKKGRATKTAARTALREQS